MNDYRKFVICFEFRIIRREVRTLCPRTCSSRENKEIKGSIRGLDVNPQEQLLSASPLKIKMPLFQKKNLTLPKNIAAEE